MSDVPLKGKKGEEETKAKPFEHSQQVACLAQHCTAQSTERSSSACYAKAKM